MKEENVVRLVGDIRGKKLVVNVVYGGNVSCGRMKYESWVGRGKPEKHEGVYYLLASISTSRKFVFVCNTVTLLAEKQAFGSQ